MPYRRRLSFSVLSASASGFGVLVDDFAINDFVFRLVHVQQDIQFIQSCRLGAKLFFLREGTFYFNLRVGKLYPDIFKLLSAGDQPFFHAL